MAKLRGVDAKLQRLHALRDEKAGPDLVAELRRALSDPSNLVAATAAEIVGARAIAELTPDLVAAFDCFMTEPDKLCRAKSAVVVALNQLDYDGDDVYLRGIRHVQPEPVWGGAEDAAATLRGDCALALARISHPEALNLCADLLADDARTARLAAAQALGASGRLAAVPLLRYKARAGDDDPAVTAECLTALLRLAPKESLPFVTEFLDASDEAIQEGAALALAESRQPELLGILQTFWSRARRGSMQEAVLLAISMLRSVAGFDWLLDLFAKERPALALHVLSALAIHRHNESLKARIAAAVDAKGDAALRKQFEEKFE